MHEYTTSDNNYFIQLIIQEMLLSDTYSYDIRHKSIIIMICISYYNDLLPYRYIQLVQCANILTSHMQLTDA